MLKLVDAEQNGKPRLRRIILAFTRENDYKAQGQGVQLTVIGERRIKSLAQSLMCESRFLDLGQLKIIAESDRDHTSLAAMSLGNHLDIKVSTEDFFSGYQGLFEELQSEDLNVDTIIFYTSRYGQTLEWFIKEWNSQYPLYGYQTPYYPPSGGHDIAVSIDFATRTLSWLIEETKSKPAIV